jgi:hypothetical protein
MDAKLELLRFNALIGNLAPDSIAKKRKNK